jgi:hypothetical protein
LLICETAAVIRLMIVLTVLAGLSVVSAGAPEAGTAFTKA